MTRANQRFSLAIAVLTLDAALMAALVYMALLGKQVSGENILFMAAGIALNWGSTTLGFYFGTSEGSVHKSELLAEREEHDK
jgi:hypothetical protein